jgi:hypothetical protein
MALTTTNPILGQQIETRALGQQASKTQQQRIGTLAPQNDYERVFTYDG